MLPQFTITIIKSDNIVKEYLLKVEQDFKTKEVLGQIIDPNTKPTLELVSDRVSHCIKNIRYNHLTESLIGEIEILPTVYGIQLARIYEQTLDTLLYHPVYCDHKFIRVDIGIKHEKD